MRRPVIFVAVLAALFLQACKDYQDVARIRAEKAASEKQEVRIAAVWPEAIFGSEFFKGIDLAVKEINDDGGIGGRRLVIEKYDDRNDLRRALNMAERISRDTDIVAVLGHPSSEIAIPVSITYQYYGLLFVTTGATNPSLTHHGFSLVFRFVPTDNDFSSLLAVYAAYMGYSRVAVVNVRNAYGSKLASIFEEEAKNHGVDVVTRISYFEHESDFKPMVAHLKDMELDAVFLAGRVPQGAVFVKQMRFMDLNLPVFSSDGMDSELLLKIAGDSAEGTVVASMFNPLLIKENDAQYYYDHFGEHPTTSAAIGYDSLMLLAHVFRTSDSLEPEVVASFLRHVEGWEGVTGKYSFNLNGDIEGRELCLKVVENEQFRVLDLKEVRDAVSGDILGVKPAYSGSGN